MQFRTFLSFVLMTTLCLEWGHAALTGNTRQALAAEFDGSDSRASNDSYLANCNGGYYVKYDENGKLVSFQECDSIVVDGTPSVCTGKCEKQTTSGYCVTDLRCLLGL